MLVVATLEATLQRTFELASVACTSCLALLYQILNAAGLIDTAMLDVVDGAVHARLVLLL